MNLMTPPKPEYLIYDGTLCQVRKEVHDGVWIRPAGDDWTWQMCLNHETYQRLRAEWLAEHPVEG